MNRYSDYYEYDRLDRRSHFDIGFSLGDAIGSMITATVLGLSRPHKKETVERRHGPMPQSANDEIIVEASGWR